MIIIIIMITIDMLAASARSVCMRVAPCKIGNVRMPRISNTSTIPFRKRIRESERERESKRETEKERGRRRQEKRRGELAYAEGSPWLSVR